MPCNFPFFFTQKKTNKQTKKQTKKTGKKNHLFNVTVLNYIEMEILTILQAYTEQLPCSNEPFKHPPWGTPLILNERKLSDNII